MARWFLVTLFVACLLCVIQAFPQGAAETATTEPKAFDKVESAVNDALNSLKKGIEGIMSDPKINQMVQEGKEFLDKTATAIQTEAAKIMPKTDESPK